MKNAEKNDENTLKIYEKSADKMMKIPWKDMKNKKTLMKLWNFSCCEIAKEQVYILYVILICNMAWQSLAILIWTKSDEHKIV